ncbi:UNVERIFIED_CONTAM: Retrovirus-related Pol polyprotein from transposon TNT 1-94 [Sesamum latifolium]|uniref:Retrovirus-related Pol polyprotein from transposon TNT 1-94 n=1 Tax=Sesamum latifolium TaxID=2727402 RepID=A0AAW2VFS8_9LAMI
MVEVKSVAEQTHEIINLEHALADVEMELPEIFLVMSIVDKFSKSWKNFGMTLKHQKGRLSLDDLMIAISINKGKTTKNKKSKANIPCWNCGQVGHWTKLCPNKRAKTGQAAVNMAVGGSSGAKPSGATEGYLYVQPELLTIYEPCDWLIDTGANLHICADKSLFVPYQAISGMTVSMGNSSTAEVLGIGSMDLKFPSGLILSLKRVHHVPTVKRNIISGSVIVREGYELAFKFNKVVIQQFGIFVETPPYSPSSNGVAERKNMIFKDMINSLLLTFGLPKYLWGEALNKACYILNRVPLKDNKNTPFELWKEIPGVEINTIVEFCKVVFLEDVFPIKIGIPSSVSLDDSLASTSIPEHVEKMSNMGVNPSSTSPTHKESDEPRRSKRARVVKDFGSDFITYNIEDNPISFRDAMASSEAKQWKEAVKSFKGIDSFDTYSPVARLTIIWVLIALASVYNLSIHQMDVKTAFLYGELEEEIYMDQPEGFVVHGSCLEIITETKSFLKNKFEMKDMGEADVILGIKLIRSTDGIAISQSHYVEKIIEKFGYHNCRIAKTPYDSSVAFVKMKVVLRLHN